MSHFVCVVVGDDPDGQLAPFDENLAVEERRDYESSRADDDAPRGWWYVRPIVVAGHLPADGDLTWRQAFDGYVAYFTAQYPDEIPEYQYDEEKDRIYSLSTANPQGRWDYYRLGGRWGGFFELTREAAGQARALAADGEIALPEAGWDSPTDLRRGMADGGLRKHLDFEGMRDAAGGRARKMAEDYAAEVEAADLVGVEATRPFMPWSQLVERVQAETLTIDEARDLYCVQPRVERVKRDGFMTASHEDLMRPVEVQVDEARRGALTGFCALVDGEWIAPGEMGWFGASSDTVESRRAHDDRVNALLDGLEPDVWVRAYDLHS